MYFACRVPETGRMKIMFSVKQDSGSWGVAHLGLIARYFFLSPATTYAHSASMSSGFSRSPQGGMFLIP